MQVVISVKEWNPVRDIIHREEATIDLAVFRGLSLEVIRGTVDAMEKTIKEEIKSLESKGDPDADPDGNKGN